MDDIATLTKTVNSLVTSNGIIQNEMKNISKTMERFAEMLEKQIEHDNKLVRVQEDVDEAFTLIRNIEKNGTQQCSNHNTQFAEYDQQAKAGIRILSSELAEIKKEVSFRWDEIKEDIHDIKTSFAAACDTKSGDIKEVKSVMDARFKARDDRAWKLAFFLLSPVYSGLIALLFVILGGK